MNNKITLFATATGSKVDRENGILKGVSVVTQGDAKGHTWNGAKLVIDATTINQVKDCAETYSDGLRVKFDHGTGIAAMVGVLKNFAVDGTQLRADLCLIKTGANFETIMEMAETMPGAFGLSIVFSGDPEAVIVTNPGDDVDPEGVLPDDIGVDADTDDTDDQEPASVTLPVVMAARCLEIYSCDLVDQPAANPSGLFSEPAAPAVADPVEVVEPPLADETNVCGNSADSTGEGGGSPPVETTLSEVVTDFTTLTTQAQELSATNSRLITELADKDAAIVSLSTQLAEQSIALAAATATATALQAEGTKIKSLHTALKESYGLAAAGVMPEVSANEQSRTPAEYQNEWLSIKDPSARAAFYKKFADKMQG